METDPNLDEESAWDGLSGPDEVDLADPPEPGEYRGQSFYQTHHGAFWTETFPRGTGKGYYTWMYECPVPGCRTRLHTVAPGGRVQCPHCEATINRISPKGLRS
jgi:hypothetical protein